MIPTLTIRIFQFNWLFALMQVLVKGLTGNWASMIAQIILALSWAYLIQRFAKGEDLIATYFVKKKEKTENPTT